MGQVEMRRIHESQGTGEKTVVLWVSRHPPLPAQVKELEGKLGPVAVYQLSGMIPNAEYVAEKVAETSAEYVVPVLPLSMIARLTELARRQGFTVLWAEMEQIAQGTGTPPTIDETREVVTQAHGTWKVMRFKAFHVVKAVRLELEPF